MLLRLWKPAGFEPAAPGLMFLTNTVPTTWPLLRCNSTPLLPSLAANTSNPLRFNKLAGSEPKAPGRTSLTKKVPVAEPFPLLFQISIPFVPSLAAKNTFPLMLVIPVGLELAALALMFFTSNVLAAVPVLFHSS